MLKREPLAGDDLPNQPPQNLTIATTGASGATYQQNVRDFVNLLISNGITPLIEMHWNFGQYTGPSAGCSDAKATCQKPMPDAQNAPSFWTGVANAFKGNNAVVFDLFNEPYPERASGSVAIRSSSGPHPALRSET